jgi:hypothetical protein
LVRLLPDFQFVEIFHSCQLSAFGFQLSAKALRLTADG